MSPHLPSKRRKLNGPTSTLSRPFVSPVRTATAGSEPRGGRSSETSDPACLPNTPAHTTKTHNALRSGHHPLSEPVKRDLHTTRTTPARRPPCTPWLSRKQADPEEVAAQKACNALETQIKKTQNEIDALRQARQLSNSSTDADLEELTEKWRLATQAVAEELFGSAKERVCRMGGVAAWREMEKKRYSRSHGIGDFAQPDAPEDDDADCEFDSQGEELPEDEQLYRKKMKRQALKEMAEAADVPEQQDSGPQSKEETQVWAEVGQDDDTFTMDMMLRSLNIDLDVIGYDKEAQRWVT